MPRLSLADSALSAIEKIDKQAMKQKRRFLKSLQAAITSKRTELDKLYAAVEAIGGQVKHVLGGSGRKMAGKPGRTKPEVNSSGGRRKRKRMNDQERAEKLEILKGLDGKTLPTAQILEKLDIKQANWPSFRTTAKNAGLTLKQVGPNRKAQWQISAK